MFSLADFLKVKTEGIKTRHHHLAYEGGSNASPTQEETQNFPYHPSATVFVPLFFFFF